MLARTRFLPKIRRALARPCADKLTGHSRLLSFCRSSISILVFVVVLKECLSHTGASKIHYGVNKSASSSQT
jgi:hypothetical protein